MAKSKIRLPTITAELTQWRLDKIAKTVIAIDSRDGKPVIIRNFAYAVDYPSPKGEENGAYYLLRTHTGEYFKMKLSDEKPS